MEWFSWVIAIILLLSSIVSPIATTLINNYHQSKIKKIDIYEASKKEALSEFINSAQLSIYDPLNPELGVDYQKSFHKLFLYFSNLSLGTLMNFEDARSELAKKDCTENYQKANCELTNIVVVLSKQIAKE